MVAATCPTIFASLTPATVIEIASEIEGLALHFPVLRRTDEENRVVVRQWAEDLAEFPRDLIEEAARLWRNGTNDRFPTPGQFKAPLEPILKFRRLLAKRADEFMA